MAEGKKSVLLYCDLIHTIEKMDNETAGQFFKHYLRYINDLNPITENILVDVTFESVKQNLKRDLKKWENRAYKSRENGKLGGRPKKEETQKTQQVILEPKKPDTVNVTVTDTVNDNVTDILLKKETKNNISERKLKFSSTISPFLKIYGKEMLNDFYLYWTEPNQTNTKLKFEMEKTWSVERRLATWRKNEDKFYPIKKSNNEQPKSKAEQLNSDMADFARRHGIHADTPTHDEFNTSNEFTQHTEL